MTPETGATDARDPQPMVMARNAIQAALAMMVMLLNLGNANGIRQYWEAILGCCDHRYQGMLIYRIIQSVAGFSLGSGSSSQSLRPPSATVRLWPRRTPSGSSGTSFTLP